MISKTAYVSGEPYDQDEALELQRLAELAAAVVDRSESWIAAGLGHDVALALVQNALPLREGAQVLERLQRRSHARVLTALLLLLDDPAAGELATDLAEALHRGPARERSLAS